MVVGFVFEHQQPIFLAAVVHGHLDLHRAGVDFFAFVLVGELAFRLELTCADGSQIHQGHGLVFPAQLFAGVEVIFISLLNGGLFDLYVVDVGREGGVAAVVGPIGVDHPDFGDGGVPLLFLGKVLLAEQNVVQIHS